MAAEHGSIVESSKDMTIEDLHDLSNMFSSEFNCSDIHDRVLCFEIIKDKELVVKDDSEDNSESGSNIYVDVDKDRIDVVQVAVTAQVAAHTKDPVEGNFTAVREDKVEKEGKVEGKDKAEKEEKIVTEGTEDKVKTEYEAETKETACHELQKVLQQLGKMQLGDKPELDGQKIEKECGEKDSDISASEVADDKNKSIVSKLFVHSQLLAVQSPYFKALFYSGMKETYSKEVIMKIHQHELEAHQTLIEAMYKLDVLSDKDYRLVVHVLVLAHKYDARHVFKKCKYVLLSTIPSLEMCECILKEIKHLSVLADIYDVLEKFLVKEFTPIDDTWTLKKFTNLSEAALRLLLKSDNLGTRSENTIFVALMKWVRTNTTLPSRKKCSLLDLVKFEFMSVNFLYDVVQNHVVARHMPGFQQYLLNGLAYHAFSQTRREQLEPKPKKRPVLPDATPTFSWVIDGKLQKGLTNSPETSVWSDRFWYKGYPMELELDFSKDLNKCSFFLMVLELKNKACLYVSCRAKSSLFAETTIRVPKHLFTAKKSGWGYGSLDCNKAQTGKSFTIDVWVEIHEQSFNCW